MRKEAGVAAQWDRRRFIAFFLSGLVMTSIALSSPLLAQVAPPIFDPTLRSGEPPAPLKKEFRPPVPEPSPTLPSVPAPPDGDARTDFGRIRVFVKAIRVTGNTSRPAPSFPIRTWRMG
jgi:hypothetical protein